jgi:hypothetical protein
MHRRDFLKLGGLISTALLVQISSLGSFAVRPVEAESDGKRYRGTSDGRILVSSDSGKAWQLHTNFGTHFSITGLSTDYTGKLRARLEFASYPFELAFAQDSQTWKTV